MNVSRPKMKIEVKEQSQLCFLFTSILEFDVKFFILPKQKHADFRKMFKVLLTSFTP